MELEPRRLDGAAESGGRLAKTLRRDGHENFVSCVALRAHKPREVVSGGLDARVCVWDRDKNAAVRRWDVPELIAAFDRASAERAEMGKKKRAGEEEARGPEARFRRQKRTRGENGESVRARRAHRCVGRRLCRARLEW